MAGGRHSAGAWGAEHHTLDTVRTWLFHHKVHRWQIYIQAMLWDLMAGANLGSPQIFEKGSLSCFHHGL